MRYARHIIIFVITIGITFMFGCRANSDNHAVLAWVNDEPVTLGEFKVYFSRHRSDVFSFIADKYQVSDSESFWTHRYKDGEVPIELAKKATLDELAKVKLEQIYMKQNNICSDISYSNFLIKLKNENADRQKKIKDGQAIYGPKQYREVDYYKYIQNINVIKLKEYLGHYAFDTSQENLKKEYEIMKANYIEFKNGDTIKVKVIFVPWKEQKESNTDLSYIEAKKIIIELKNKLDNGVSFGQVLSQNKDTIIEQEYSFDTREDRKKDKLGKNPIMEIVFNMTENQISDILEYDNKFVLIKCLQRERGTYKDFNEVMPIVKNRFIDMKYKELLEREFNACTIKINEPVYNKISARQ